MNRFTLALAGLRGGGITHLLNVLVLTLGIATVTLLLLFSATITHRLLFDAGRVDIVVGAKGSPLQLVLSTVFQADIPTGNIDGSELAVLQHNPMIARAIPLALGDAASSFRIVGTTPDYISLYGAKVAQGRVYQAPMEAVLGADVERRMRLQLGQRFVGAHGVYGEGELHDGYPYTVTGILAPTGTVIDRLILTPVESVWEVHTGEGGERHEVTAVLLQARMPLAIVTLPYAINMHTPYMAALPSGQAVRLLSLLGFGLSAFRALGAVLIVSAGLGMLATLSARLRGRTQELATLRLLGASRGMLFSTILIEALVIAVLGAVLGLALGHAAAWCLAASFPAGDALATISAGWQPGEWELLAAALLAGLLAAVIPAITAYRTDVSAALAGVDD